MELSLEVLGLLFLVAGLAGFIDAIAGGGGLLTVPACLPQAYRPPKRWRRINCRAHLGVSQPRCILSVMVW